MNATKFTPAVETPDGTRTVFNTQSAYQAGTLRVLINGIFQRATLDDGFVETSPPEFEMKIAPETGDTIWTFYREA